MRLFSREITYPKLRAFLRKFKFSIIIVPEEHSSVFPTISLKFWRAIIILSAIAVLAFLFSVLIVINTSVRYYVFNEKIQLTHKQVGEIDELTKKVQYLLQEIEKQKKLNKMMQDAILRGDSSAINKVQNAGKKQGGFVAGVFRELLAGENTASQQNDVLQLMKPSNGVRSQGFNAAGGHLGIDYSISSGNPVIAASGGYIAFADFTVNDGYMIIMVHSGGYLTVYKHLSALLKSSMARVRQGEVIGLSGSTGKLSGGPHLHFELWKDGSPVDPSPFVIE